MPRPIITRIILSKEKPLTPQIIYPTKNALSEDDSDTDEPGMSKASL